MTLPITHFNSLGPFGIFSKQIWFRTSLHWRQHILRQEARLNPSGVLPSPAKKQSEKSLFYSFDLEQHGSSFVFLTTIPVDRSLSADSIYFSYWLTGLRKSLNENWLRLAWWSLGRKNGCWFWPLMQHSFTEMEVDKLSTLGAWQELIVF